MKLSINWLKKFLNLDGFSPEEIASRLTMNSFEVEEIHKTGTNLSGPIVIGKILNIEKHPNADKLSLTKVTIDSKNELEIVCGATNIKAGQTVPVALPGAIVQNRQDGSELLIKTTKIRGIESHGMLCSATELGIKTDDKEGILILPDSAPTGKSLMDYLSLEQDTVMVVAARSNRGDALSVYGLSKEISALIKKPLKEINFKEPEVNKNVLCIQPKIENPADTCLFYTATIEDICVMESPQWLKSLLESTGTRSINNIVDITNYINFSFGQPLHAYDREKLNGKSLISRSAKTGEKILTLDGKVRSLKENVLVIADEKEPQAIAGIMGGQESEVNNNTKAIVLEAAVFNPQKVRRGSRTVGLTSEASKRFERGVDSHFTYKAMLAAIELIQELASQGNKKPKVGQIFQAGEPLKEKIKITFSPHHVKRTLGINVSSDEICKLLEPLEFKTSKLRDNLEVSVPSFRSKDVTRPIDLVEEVTRLYGYNRIPAEPPQSTLSSNKLSNNLDKIKNYFLSSGFSETYLSSLIGEQILNYKEFGFNDSSSISMNNPLSKEHYVLRQNLLPGLLEALKLNQSYQTNYVRLFEIGKAYFYNKIKPKNEKETNVSEDLRIAGLASGNEINWAIPQNIYKNPLESLFFNIKGILENFFIKNHIKVEFIKTSVDFLHPHLALSINLNDKLIGYVGALHPQIEQKHKLSGPSVVFEFKLEPILNKLEGIKTFEKISSQPYLERDITIDLPKKYTAQTVKNEIEKIKSSFVINIKLISIYELDKENKSLTYRLIMQEFDETLTGKQVEDELNKIKKHLTACLQAKFRV